MNQLIAAIAAVALLVAPARAAVVERDGVAGPRWAAACTKALGKVKGDWTFQMSGGAAFWVGPLIIRMGRDGGQSPWRHEPSCQCFELFDCDVTGRPLSFLRDAWKRSLHGFEIIIGATPDDPQTELAARVRRAFDGCVRADP